MSVQRRQQGRPTLDDPNPGMRAAMNAALVTFGGRGLRSDVGQSRGLDARGVASREV
jgi:hypothetical protein